MKVEYEGETDTLSEDHQEALAALREKRLPVFKDR